MATGTPSSAEAPISLTEARRLPTELAGEFKPQLAGAGERRTEAGGLWFAPYGSVGTVYGDATNHSASYALHGFAAGGDLAIAENFLIGVALSYSSTAFDQHPHRHRQQRRPFLVVHLDAGYSPRPWYVDAALGYAYNWGSLSRTIAFPGIFRTAQGNPTANQFLGGVESGLAVPLDRRLALTPFGRLEVTSATQNGFSESGAGAIGLNAGVLHRLVLAGTPVVIHR